MFADTFHGKTVWLSGHTGFKGAWLAQWLVQMGARVHGFALPPATEPSVFEQLGLAKKVGHEIADIRDAGAVRKSILRVQPDFVFHLAAQALVRYSYEHPLETYATNVMGTAHVLEALRPLEKKCAVVIVTTDKCYENREQDYAYAEEDHLGGHDPYSSSKGAAEIVTAAYRRSFFGKSPVRIASARAGNVIGGGDWAMDRIVPDCIRKLNSNLVIEVRNPEATRPWQHVLEPLSGYLWLAAAMAGYGKKQLKNPDVCSAFNFGPSAEADRSVGELVEELLKHLPGSWADKRNPVAVHEAHLLQLCADKARLLLKWSPVWQFADAVEQTANWYRMARKITDAGQVNVFTRAQIEAFCTHAQKKQLLWALEPEVAPEEMLRREEELKACAV